MDRSTLLHDLTLMLIYASAWEEESFDGPIHRSWKGYDFDTLDLLTDEGLISGSRKAKSVYLEHEGVVRAQQLLKDYGIVLDPEPSKQRFFRMFLSFNFEELHCSRTLLVPEHTTFEDFHTMIQACFNWMNYHLYDFVLKGPQGEVCISWPDYETGEDPRLEFYFEGEQLSPWVNAQTSYLDDYFPVTREATYSYDYGDGWEIKIRLINQGERIASDNPICAEGNGDVPPEDVGGEGGFIEFIEVTGNPNDEEYKSMCEWGKSQGFEHFSQPLANKRLSHWSDWARADVNKMSRQAQMKAFGKILVEPGQDLFKENNSFLLMFEKHLNDSGLHPRTVQSHLDNVYFFLDEYLRPRGMHPAEGLSLLEQYLGNWLINSYAYTSRSFLKNSATSLNKFYQWMASCGYVDAEEQQRIQRLVRAHIFKWEGKIPLRR